MNKVSLTALLLGLFGLCMYAADKTSILSSGEIVWTGLDYSHAKLIGPGQFNKPEAIVPDMFEKWNQLFLRERIRVIEKQTKKSITIDIEAVNKANKTGSPQQIVTSPVKEDSISNTHITKDDIAAMVKAYDLKNTNGLALVFIVDRFVKLDKNGQGAVYVVAFDIATREVVFSQREATVAGGFGFRNYWFRPIKNAEKALKNLH
jgi:hypothetical protein